MPALFTHYKFGQDLLNNIDDKLKQEITNNILYYNMFNQGFDNLFYYPIHWQYYKNFAITAHKKHITKFFTNMIQYILDNNLTNNSDITNMVYGFINHYTLDTIIHPFINYQVKNLNIPHTKIEFTLDSRINTNFDTHIYKEVIPRLHFSKDLKKLIDYVFETTYQEKNIGKIFNKSHNNDYYVYRYFVNDKNGFKTNMYKVVDFILHNKGFRLQDNTFYVKEFNEEILNSDNLKWHHPNNKKEIYNYSYEELYDYCLLISTKLNTLAYNVIHNNGDLNNLINLISKIDLKNIQEFLY